MPLAAAPSDAWGQTGNVPWDVLSTYDSSPSFLGTRRRSNCAPKSSVTLPPPSTWTSTTPSLRRLNRGRLVSGTSPSPSPFAPGERTSNGHCTRTDAVFENRKTIEPRPTNTPTRLDDLSDSRSCWRTGKFDSVSNVIGLSCNCQGGGRDTCVAPRNFPPPRLSPLWKPTVTAYVLPPPPRPAAAGREHAPA